MKNVVLTVNGKEVNVTFIGNIKDYDFRDLDSYAAGFPGSMNDEVFIDPKSKRCYVYDTIIGWKEYDGRMPIAYVNEHPGDAEYADWCLTNNWLKLDHAAGDYVLGEGWDDEEYIADDFFTDEE